jgi:hypothetical protein
LELRHNRMSSNEAGIAKVKELDRSSNAVVPEFNGLPSKVPPERVLPKPQLILATVFHIRERT